MVQYLWWHSFSSFLLAAVCPATINSGIFRQRQHVTLPVETIRAYTTSFTTMEPPSAKRVKTNYHHRQALLEQNHTQQLQLNRSTLSNGSLTTATSTTTTSTCLTPTLPRIPEEAHDPVLHGMVQFLFGRDITTPNEKGDTPLLEAAEKGDEARLAIVLLCRDQILREKGVDILLVQKSEGYTALHVAALEGHANLVQLLLEQGMDVDLENEYGQTSLHIAADFGEVEVAQLLLDHGATVNGLPNQQPPRNSSIYRPRRDVDFQKTPLHSAAAMGYEKVVALLCQRGADVNLTYGVEGKTALHDAAERGHEKTVLELLQQGADPTVKTKEGRVPRLRTWKFYPTSPLPWRREISKLLSSSSSSSVSTSSSSSSSSPSSSSSSSPATRPQQQDPTEWRELSLVKI
jgi:ankyrin repeat protein